ncbi:MAG: hypothetical protein AAB403_03115, partial [Planctomycetota bacterium]
SAATSVTDEPRFTMSALPDLRRRVDTGEFLEGLYRELADATLELKPLRVRKLDILALAYDILKREAGEGRNVPCLDLDVSVILERHSWPGNVNELQEILVRFSASGHDRLTRNDLPKAMLDQVGDVPHVTEETLRSEFLYGESLKKMLRERGKDAGWNVAARPALATPPDESVALSEREERVDRILKGRSSEPGRARGGESRFLGKRGFTGQTGDLRADRAYGTGGYVPVA